MNKLIIALAVVSALVAVVSANRHYGRRHHGDDDFEGGIYGFEGDEHHRGRHGYHGHHRHIPHYGGHGRRGFRGGRGIGRHGGFGASGIRGSEGSFGNVHSNDHLDADRFANAHDSSLIAGGSRFNADRAEGDIHENEGKRKHQVFNKDKLIVKDRETGVNDEDAFRNVNGHGSRENINQAQGGIAAQESGLNTGSRVDADREFGASHGQHAEGAAGAIEAGL